MQYFSGSTLRYIVACTVLTRKIGGGGRGVPSLAKRRLGKLSHHRQQQTAVAVRQMGRVALHLRQGTYLFLVQVQPRHLCADRLLGEELRELQVERARYLLQRLEGWHSVPVLDARKVTSQQSG